MKLSGVLVSPTLNDDSFLTTEKQKAFMRVMGSMTDHSAMTDHAAIYPRLWRFALALTKDEDDAKDLVSETVLAAYERFDSVRDEKAFLSFLFTIATRVHRHKERRARWFGAFDQDTAAKMPSGMQSPEIDAEVALLLQAMKKLPTKQRETVSLFEISGFSLDEIREIQGGSLSGVKSRLKRGREALAELLGEGDRGLEAANEQSEKHKSGKYDQSQFMLRVLSAEGTKYSQPRVKRSGTLGLTTVLNSQTLKG
jgi:RNA polymerase sigma-70 factor, ECF subfamily